MRKHHGWLRHKLGRGFLLGGLAGLLLSGQAGAQETAPPPGKAVPAEVDLIGAASTGPQADSVKGSWVDDGCCGPAWCGWVGVEALGWAISGQSVPPLVTRSPAGTNRNLAGVIGAPGTEVLYGDQAINGNMQPGIRVYGGMFLDAEKLWAVEGSFYTLFGGDTNYLSPNDPVVSRPFVNGLTGLNDSQLVQYPNVLGGNVGVTGDQCFWGLDVNLRRNLCCVCDSRWDVIGGYRNMGLNEGLGINENLTTLDNSLGYPANNNILVNDSFNTKNVYNGAQIGLGYMMWRGKWMLDARGLVGLGGTCSTVNINGSTTVIAASGAASTLPGGLLAQGTNIGSYSSSQLSFVPEVGVRLGYQIAPRVAVTAGYTFMYWTGVARPGEQIDTVVNPSQIPPGTLNGPARPAFNGVNTSDIWIQGISTGLEFRF